MALPVLLLLLPAPSLHAFAFFEDRVRQLQPPGGGALVTVPDPYYWSKCVRNNLNGGPCTLNITFNLAQPLNAAGTGALNTAVGIWQGRTVAPNAQQPGNLGALGANDPVHTYGRQNFDLQTTLVHELGHAFGFDHPEMGRDRPVDSTGRPIAFQQARFTASTFGPNGRYEFDPGQPPRDAIPGTADDQRGDDLSVHLVDADNNPLNAAAGRVDRTTFFLHALFNQPQPNSYAQTSTREVARTISNNPNLGLESVMVQDWAAAETRRALSYDDLNGLLYLQSGRDQDATLGVDNFTFRFAYDARGARGRADNAPPPGIDVLVSDFPNLDERALSEPVIDRRGLFSDVVISLSYGAATESDLLYGTGSRFLLGRSDAWLDSSGEIAFVDIFVDRIGTVPEPATLALFGLGLAVFLRQRRYRAL